MKVANELLANELGELEDFSTMDSLCIESSVIP
jgi:hypothetical protein